MENFGSILESEEIIFPDLDRYFKKAEEDLNEYRVKIDEFVLLYGEKQVRADQERVDSIKNKFMKENSSREIDAKKLAIIFESIFNEHAELSNWLGENAAVIPTHEFDDIINGIDAIVEFSKEGKNPDHLGLGIDVTYSSHLGEKFGKIKERIDNGKLSSIKYFHSDNMGFTGRLSKVPRVVVSVDKETVKELVVLRDKKANKELSEHFIQFQILEEILIQLDIFMDYAEKIGKADVVRKFEVARNIVAEVYEQKKESMGDSGKRDSSFEKMKKQLSSTFSLASQN